MPTLDVDAAPACVDPGHRSEPLPALDFGMAFVGPFRGGLAVAIRMGALGDVVLTTGVLEHWRVQRNLNCVVVTRDLFAPLLAGHPAVERSVGVTPADMQGVAWMTLVRRLARQFRGHLLIDLHGSIRSRIMSLCWAGPVARYPRFAVERRLYRTWRLASAERTLLDANVPQRYAMALDATPPPPEVLAPRIVLSTTELQAARELTGWHAAGLPLVALHPYATHPSKAWPRRHWEELAHAVDKAGWGWVAVGRDPSPFFGEMNRHRDLTNRTDLRTTSAVIASASVLITADSGPMHLASAVGTPVIGLFGPTSRVWGFFPAGPRDEVLELSLPCRPCSLHGRTRKACAQECLTGITVGDVVDRLRRVLA